MAQYSQRLRGERGVNLEIRVGVNTVGGTRYPHR